MKRVVLPTVLFAALAIVAVALLAWFAYRSVRGALEQEFERRIESLASTTAAQVRPEDLEDVRIYGEEGTGYLAIQVVLEQLCSASSTTAATLLDSARVVVYDCRTPETQGATSVLDSVARAALATVASGRTAVTGLIPRAAGARRFALAPVLSEVDHGHTVAVLAVEVEPVYLAQLAALGRQLALITAVIALA
ncbi:MAG: hypothetical protein HOP12_10235, partial [Candidatus Eisenbacteria bacterium]|nr:hypothetical protein [Candidatus Eisenbacteria bacterium]